MGDATAAGERKDAGDDRTGLTSEDIVFDDEDDEDDEEAGLLSGEAAGIN